MPRARSVQPSEDEQEKSNGRNGAGVYAEQEPAPSSGFESEVRRVVVIQGLLGTDARALYYTLPGATGDGWVYLERLLEPLRRFLLDGDPPWLVQPVTVQQASYRGIETPAGDCAEDALPQALKNPYRAAAKNGDLKT